MASKISASAAAAADDTWSKLPADLLGEVYGWIVSPIDRVRFTAVCRSWRVIKSWQQLAPTFPWLIFSSCQGGVMRVFCPMDGVSLRVSLPPQALRNRLVGSYDGGWIAATSSRYDGDWLAIVNLFSGVEAPLSAKQRAAPLIKKLICSERPMLNRCILAAILTDGIGVCRVGCRNHNWLISRKGYTYDDIVFYDGKLCALLRRSICMYKISMTKKSNLVVSITYLLDMNQLPKYTGWGADISCIFMLEISYIFKHGDKMLMAKRAQWSLEKRLFFKVFELTKNMRYGYSWVEVTTLDDYALFLSTTCSKMMYVPADMRGGVERNHIYYNHINLLGDSKSIGNDIQLTSCDTGEHLYSRKDKKINGVDRIESIGYYITSHYSNITNHYEGLTWLLPPDF